tara:strand:- start:95 stop:427 length:333 start_codon:yes stop_codon:yes gene_type:complete
MKKIIILILLTFFGCQKPCEPCEDCSWDNELEWALSVDGQECMYISENNKCLEYFEGESEGFEFIKVRKIVVTDIADGLFILNVVPGGDYDRVFEMGYEYVKYKKEFKDE